jgi:hypothetical protein
MCRALQILCVAAGRPSLQALKKAVVAQEWELTPGATTMAEALDQLDERKAHVLVAWGNFGALVKEARDRYPTMRIISISKQQWDAADVNLTSIAGVRHAILGTPPVGGPVR